ncbi:MAG: NUDIX domain-containing protein [Alphaproteobacteria bacterium]|nr:MAG: NUDIX domain-containing protein [Alphaproteobacteria bacterium]
MADTYLSVVDNDDVVIGRQLRSIIHREGLRHREVHVWFVTKKNELIFQRRGPHKDTYPECLDATAGGHVEEGQDYMKAAVAEVSEETGMNVPRHMLTPLGKVDVLQEDAPRHVVNRVYRMVYLYRYAGEVADLKVEQGDGGGFELIALTDVLAKRGALINQLVPGLLEPAYAPVWKSIQDVLRV